MATHILHSFLILLYRVPVTNFYHICRKSLIFQVTGDCTFFGFPTDGQTNPSNNQTTDMPNKETFRGSVTGEEYEGTIINEKMQ